MFKTNSDSSLQTIVDEIAYSTNLPLQILDLNALLNIKSEELLLHSETSSAASVALYQEILENIEKGISSVGTDSILEKQPLLLTYQELPAAIRSLSVDDDNCPIDKENYIAASRALAILKSRLLKTEISNPNPIAELYSLLPEWCWFELLWLFNARDLIESSAADSNSEVFSIDAFSNCNWKVFFKQVGDNSNFLIFTGPLVPKQHRNDLSLVETQNKSILDFCSQFSRIYSRWSITKRTSRIDLERIEQVRVPLTENSIRNRLELAEQSLSYIASNCGGVTTTEYTNSGKNLDLTAYARNTMSVSRLASSTWFREAIKEEISGERLSIFSGIMDKLRRVSEFKIEIRVPSRIDSENTQYAHYAYLIYPDQITNGRSYWDFDQNEHSLFLKSTAVSTDEDQIAIYVDGFQLMNNTTMDNVANKFDRWEETSLTRKRYQLATSARLLGDWMSHKYLNTTTDTVRKSPDGDSRIEESNGLVYDFICDHIRKSLRVDLCHLYRFYAHDDNGTVRILGKAVTEGTWSIDELELIATHMDEVSKRQDIDESDRKNTSIVFRAISSRQISVHYDHQQANSESLKISCPQDIKRPGSVMVVPILVEGRVWGCIEVASIDVQLYSEASMFASSEYSKILSVFLFNITYNNNIRKMGFWAGHIDNEPNGYKKISKALANYICKINLARGAAIFLKSDDDVCSYDLLGYSGPDYFELDNSDFSIDMMSPENQGLLMNILWNKNRELGLTSVIGKIDQEAEGQLVKDSPPYYILGSKYGGEAGCSSVVDKLVNDGVSHVVAFTFDIDQADEKRFQQNTRQVFGIPITSLQRTSDGPTGIVLVYFHDFMARPHWSGVNADIANRLMNCFEDVLFAKNRQDDIGKLIRHEVKQTVTALGGVLGDVSSSGRSVTSKIRELNALLLPSPSKLKESQLDYVANLLKSTLISSRNIANILDNTQNIFDLLDTQVLSIERSGYAELSSVTSSNFDNENMNSFVNIYSSIDLVKGNFESKNLDALRKHVDVIDIDKKLYIRIRPAYMILLLQNVFQNIYKYALLSEKISIELLPEFDPVKRPDYYRLRFSNYVMGKLDQKDVNTWFDFKKRGDLKINSVTEGEGIGLYWIQKILEERHGISVRMLVDNDIPQTKRDDEEISLIHLEWKFGPQWLTRHPEKLID